MGGQLRATKDLGGISSLTIVEKRNSMNKILVGLWGSTATFKKCTAAKASFIFLGLLDLSFNIRNGMLSGLNADSIFSGFINLWCVFFGLLLILHFVIREQAPLRNG